ncbi:hypothetical protein FOZ62_010517, partial [Perkinsus olseni]
YSNGWGLACFGNLYNGGCKCSAAMQDLCTPVCQTHLPFLRCSAGTETIDMQISWDYDLVARVGTRTFTRRLQMVANSRLFAAFILCNAKARIVSRDEITSEL